MRPINGKRQLKVFDHLRLLVAKWLAVTGRLPWDETRRTDPALDPVSLVAAMESPVVRTEAVDSTSDLAKQGLLAPL